MRLVAISDYIYFGTTLRYLQDCREGWGVTEPAEGKSVVDMFLSSLEDFELPVTRRLCRDLVQLGEELADLGPDAKLTADQATSFNNAANALERTLMAEAAGKHAFIVTDKRMDVQKLLFDVSALLAPDVFEGLPRIAQHDLDEAGKCLAFNRPTAAAFFMLRGTEAMLREFYCSIVKRKRVKLMWGPMVESLRQRRKKPPPKSLLDNLDNIRESFRNPTQHPEAVYDIHGAQDLFGLCVEVLNRMVLHLHQ